jgi:hypothetical protein
LTQHNDNSRSGQNTNETLLTTSNVNVNQFGKLYSLPVDGHVYAQPLYIPGVTINGATHNVLIVATENDSVYAFDADSKTPPLWQASMVDSAHGAVTGETALNILSTPISSCTDLQPKIGITSTPVVDPSSSAIFVEAKSTDGTNYYHRLHALDLFTGTEKSSGPALITATVSGTGDGSSNGQLTFYSLGQHSRPGLLLLNGTVYVAFASHCDQSPFHGWLFAYDENTLTRKSLYITTPNGGLGGFWMSGSGIAADSSGNIYIATGNGTFDTSDVPATEVGGTILKLGTTNQILTLLDYFTPQDQAYLNSSDFDLGSGGVLVLPNLNLLVQAGKEGRIYVTNLSQMTTGNSHYCSGCANDPEIVEESLSGAIGGMYSMPAYWNNNLYFWASGDTLKSIPITNDLPDFTHITSNTVSFGFPGATPSISSNGTTQGTAILWAIDSSLYGSPGPGPGPAVLHALDATNISTELWNSSQAPNNRDQAGNAVKFSVPTIADGRVYIGTSTEVDVYGLLGSGASPVITSATTGSGTVGSAFSYQITATNSPTSYGATGLPGGLTVNSATGLISGTPTASGTSAVTLSATNNSGTGEATLTLTIAVGVPVITSATTGSGTVRSAFSYQITATNSPTSYGATRLPGGLTVNSATGLISGTPTAPGTSTVTLSATNNSGTGKATLTLAIKKGHH